MALLQNLLQKTPRQWEMLYHGWFVGVFCIVGDIFFYWFLLVGLFSFVGFGVFLQVGFETGPGVYWPAGVGKGTPWSCEIPALL